MNLTFGEQVKIILSRKGMTIKELAELVEQHTGKPMSRQNMTQRLGRDNFQEQDMRMIAEILGCRFTLSIMEPESAEVSTVAALAAETAEEMADEAARDITIGELVEMAEEMPEETSPVDVLENEGVNEKVSEETSKKTEEQIEEERNMLRKGIKGFFKKASAETGGEVQSAAPVAGDSAESEGQPGEMNPYTRKEYETNSVRMHPKRIGYVQVYDREQHKWTDMTEWAFLGYQERKKKLLGKDYKPPIYLD